MDILNYLDVLDEDGVVEDLPLVSEVGEDQGEGSREGVPVSSGNSVCESSPELRVVHYVFNPISTSARVLENPNNCGNLFQNMIKIENCKR